MKKPSPPKRSPRIPDGHQPDRRDRRQPEPPTTAGARGELHADEPAPARSPCIRGLQHVGGDAVEPGEHVPQVDQKVYRTSGMIAVTIERPVTGTSAANRARLGTV